ncbi:hypothetical protein ACWEQ8_43960, partial [Streptomyces noursei]
MSVTTLVLLLAAAVAVVLGAVALCTARVLRRQITALHAELVAARADATARARSWMMPRWYDGPLAAFDTE